MDNIIKVTGQQQERIKLPMCGKDREGNLYEVDNLSLLKNGKRFLPVMGEFHYSRYEPADWEEEILKMKAGGIRIVAAYVFWIHHEERKGEWDFTGGRDLRGFLDVCGKTGMQVWLRIGPWAHGECRNGGFPDWLVKEYRQASQQRPGISAGGQAVLSENRGTGGRPYGKRRRPHNRHSAGK